MNTQDLIKLIGQGEGVSVEFKTAKHNLPNNLFETVCAFLNHNGGHILLGVKDDGTIEGIPSDNIAEMCKELSNLSNNPNKIDPPFLLQPQEFIITGKNVIYIFVPSSSQVHKTCGKVYDRSSDGDFVLKSHSKISELYLKKNNFYSENVIYPYLYEEHFKPGLLNKVRNLINSFHPGHPWLDLSDSDFYKAAGLYRYDTQNHVEGFTLAALLLFGKDEIIHSTLPYYRIEAIVRKENLERYDDRITVMCNLIDAHEQLMEFIRKHLPDTFYMEKDQRISIREKLFREIVANLLIHREYLNPSVSMITIEKDNVLAINANKPLHYENFEAYKFQSFPKNPTIALFFVQIGRAEFLGTGIRNIVKYSKAYAHSTPIFEDDNMFEVKIPLVDGEQVKEQVKEQVREQVREQVGEQVEEQEEEQVGEQVTIIETECVIRLLSVISKEHSISELMTLLQLSGRRNFIEKYISPALKDGLIEMSQPDSPNSPTQKYRLTTRGEQVKEQVGEQAREQVREQVGEQVSKTTSRLLTIISEEHSVNELMNLLHLSGRRNFIEKYIHPAIEEGFIEMSQPDSPNSPLQKYRLTAKGKQTLLITNQISIDDKEQVREQVREQVEEQVGEQVEEQVSKTTSRLLTIVSEEHSINELMNLLHLSGRRNFIEKYISPALKDGLIEMSQPDSPNSPTQKYRLTTRGEQVKEQVREQAREQVEEQVGEQVGEQVTIIETECVIRLLSVISKEHSTNELMTLLQLSGRRNFIEKYISPALKDGLIEMSQPDSPNSPTQKYRLTAKGKQIQQIILNNE